MLYNVFLNFCKSPNVASEKTQCFLYEKCPIFRAALGHQFEYFDFHLGFVNSFFFLKLGT